MKLELSAVSQSLVNEIKELREENERLAKSDDVWIPVDKKLPATTDEVLVTDGCGSFAVAWFGNQWNPCIDLLEVCCGVDIDQTITHWMPLPEPPK